MQPGRRLLDPDLRPLRIGFVNNMPNAAFSETHNQIAGLLRSGSGQRQVELCCYYIPEVLRRAEVIASAPAAYQSYEAVYDEPLDALVVTGTEPCARDLASEPYWEPLSSLLRWSVTSVPSTLLSCLAAHAAVVSLDGVERRPLAVKLSGVFSHTVDGGHPLARGLGSTVDLPHSRLNDVPAVELVARGYRIVADSAGEGWGVATREQEGRALTLFQAHPEYHRTTLLREYRRDLRRFRQGSQTTPPRIPENYLDDAGVRLLDGFQRISAGPQERPEDVPYDLAVGHIAADWGVTSVRLFSNWIADVAQRRRVAPTRPARET